MNYIKYFLFVLFLSPTIVYAQNDTIPMPNIKPPEGFKWVLNEEYSDEFNGTELDSKKWHTYFNPSWLLLKLIN